MIFLAIYFILLLVPSKNKLQQRQYFPQHSHALNIQCAFLIRRKIQGIKLFAKNLEVPCLRLPLTFGQPINWMNFGNVTHMQILWSYLLQRGNNFSKHCSRILKKKGLVYKFQIVCIIPLQRERKFLGISTIKTASTRACQQTTLT